MIQPKQTFKSEKSKSKKVKKGYLIRGHLFAFVTAGTFASFGWDTTASTVANTQV